MLRLSPAARGGYDATIGEIHFWVRDLDLGRELARTLGLSFVEVAK